MSAEIIDLRTQKGLEAYFNHLRRQMDSKTLDELHFETAVMELQLVAATHVLAWIKDLWMPSLTPENIPANDEFDRISLEYVKSMFLKAMETFTFELSPDPDMEKFLGPNWRERIKNIKWPPYKPSGT